MKVRGVLNNKNDIAKIICCKNTGTLLLFRKNVVTASPCIENMKVKSIDTVALTTAKFLNPIALPRYDKMIIIRKPRVVPLGSFHILNFGIYCTSILYRFNITLDIKKLAPPYIIAEIANIE